MSAHGTMNHVGTAALRPAGPSTASTPTSLCSTWRVSRQGPSARWPPRGRPLSGLGLPIAGDTQGCLRGDHGLRGLAQVLRFISLQSVHRTGAMEAKALTPEEVAEEHTTSWVCVGQKTLVSGETQTLSSDSWSSYMNISKQNTRWGGVDEEGMMDRGIIHGSLSPIFYTH